LSAKRHRVEILAVALQDATASFVAGKWKGPGGIARHVVLGILLSAITVCIEILLTLGPLALGATTDGRYAVDIGRTLLLYCAIGALYGAAIGAVFLLVALARSGTALAGPGYASSIALWVYLVVVAVRVVHGPTLLGPAFGPPTLGFHASAAVLAATIGYVVAKRHAQFGTLSAPVRRMLGFVAAAVIASGAGGMLSIRDMLDLDSLVERETAAIVVPSARIAESPLGTSLLLLTIDTLRADRVGAYGYQKARTPVLDRLAREGILFERATAQSSWTRPSFGTLFTSRYPSDHRAAWRLLKNAPGDRHSLYNRPLRSDLPTVAEVLDAGGYLTVGINTNVQTSRPFGFEHGFDHFIDVSRAFSVLTGSLACRAPGLGLSKLCGRWSAVSPDYPYLTGDRVLQIFQRVADRLEVAQQPFFLWLHFMDPHVPYRAHDGSGASMGYDDIERLLAGNDGAATATRVTNEMYDAAVAFADRCVGDVLARIDGSESLGPAAVLVTSDHGEELLERWRAVPERPQALQYYYRGYGHGHTMYDELLRVPLILRLPDRRYAGVRVASPVGHIDVAPTLLALAGIESSNPRYVPEGTDLVSIVRSGGDANRAMRSEAALYGSEVKALTAGGKKIIERFADGERERYDVASDPAERDNVGSDGRAPFASLERDLDAWLENVPAEPGADSGVGVDTPSIDDAQLRRQLEALGYIQ
jgi:arylsulfatase A-like enzyme